MILILWLKDRMPPGLGTLQDSMRRTVLLFDCETTGLPTRSVKGYFAPPDFGSMHLVQLAAMLYDINTHDALDLVCDLVKPDVFEIPEDATRIHGITMTRATEEGEELQGERV
jgi:DNA polymerase III epsilon subunit-like protein